MSGDAELMPRVFAVEDDKQEFDLDLPPLSGHEYLLRVQKEAELVPAVVVAEIDAGLTKSKQTVGLRHCQSSILPAPNGYAASKEIQDYQAAQFSTIRQTLANYKKKMKDLGKIQEIRLPLKEDVERWCTLCFGRYQGQQDIMSEVLDDGFDDGTGETELFGNSCQGENVEEEEEEEQMDTSCTEKKAMPPLLSIISQMDQPTLIQVLEYHVNWFEATGFTPEQGRWFYALLSGIEKPLVPEASFLLRGLARNCASLRATLPSSDDPLLPHLNLLICLVVKYFDQRDLDDNG